MNPKEFNVHNFQPVKATVGAILAKGNKVFLTKRNIGKEKGKWCLPGGHIDIGETALTAIKREVKEETNLNMRNIKFFRYFDEFLPRLKVHAIVLVFKGATVGESRPNAEVSEQRWFTQKEIEKLKMAFIHGKILDEYFKEIK